MIPDLRPDVAWFIASAETGKALSVEAAVNASGLMAWCPLEEIMTRHARRMVPKTRPLYAPYLFVGVPYGMSLAPVFTMRGITGVITFGGVPAQVQQGAMVRLQAMMARYDGVYRAEGPALFKPVPGQRYMLTDGPLKGFAGMCEDAGEEKSEIWLALLGGRRVKVPNGYLVDAT